jgi:hypothetical protein
VLGNKKDSSEREVDKEAIQGELGARGVYRNYELSAKTGEGI